MFQDLRYAIRSLLKRPAFTLVVIITLALGVGANTAIFSVTDKLLFRSLAVKNPEQLFLINSVSVSPYFVSNAFSYSVFNDYRTQDSGLLGLVAFGKTELQLRTPEGSERIRAEFVSGNYFDVLGVTAAQGRVFLPEENQTNGVQPVVVISERMRQRKFGNENPLGRTITVNSVPLTVVGVAPGAFQGMMLEEPTELWVPLEVAQSKFFEKRTDRFLRLLGRVNPNQSLSQSETQMDVMVQRVKAANTPAGTVTKGLPFSEQHIKFEPGGKGLSTLRKRFASPLKLLLAVVGLVLLIACANIGGLLLARGIARRKEIAIRLSLGATGWRIARQLLTESILLALAGGLSGLIIAPWIVSLLVNTQSRLETARVLLDQTIDTRVLMFTALTTVVAGIFFGVLPAWQSARAELIPMLKTELVVSSQRERRFNLRSLLVVAQLALAIVVLMGAGLCIKSLRNLLAVDPGYQAENLLVVPLEIDEKKYDEASGQAFQHQVFERLAHVPGVEGVSYGNVMPFSGSRGMSSLFVEGRQPLPNEMMAFDTNVVGPRYHETMGIPIAEGRGFTEYDREGSPPVVIVNDALAERLFPGERALGKRVTLKTNGPGIEIIGITRDVKHHELTEAPLPHFDLPALQRGYTSYTNVVLRTKGSPANAMPEVRNLLLGLDPSLDLRDMAPMSSQIGETLAATRLASTLIVIFGLVALLLASIGLYGVMAWMVGRRTREVGIRMALGAQTGDVLKLVMKQGFGLTLTGVAVGAFAAYVATKLIDTQQLYQVSATDPFVFVVIALLLTGVGMLACYLPARRATRVDPLKALREE